LAISSKFLRRSGIKSSSSSKGVDTGSAITSSVGASSSIKFSRDTRGYNNSSPDVRKEVRVIGGI